MRITAIRALLTGLLTVVSVASFVSSLQGTNVAGGKAPQGVPVKPYAP